MLEFFAWHLAAEDDARSVRMFDAVAFPPGGAVSLAGGQARRAPHYDIALLVEAASPDQAVALTTTRIYRHLLDPLQSQASELHVLVTRNIRRIADMPTQRGLYVFNYLAGADERATVETWERLAGLYQAQMSLDSSLLVAALPGHGQEYLAVSHTRRQTSIARPSARQLAEKQWASALQQLDRRGIGFAPYLYREAAHLTARSCRRG